MTLTRGESSRPRLLVSVSRADEVAAALEGGADIVDAKEPARGPLGAVAPEMLRAIVVAAGDDVPVSAALGDPAGEAGAEGAARAAAESGARWVKLGFLGHADGRRVRALVAAAVRGADGPGARVIAAAYADAGRVESAQPAAVLRAAAEGGAAGVLLDTAVKDGSTLWEAMRGPGAVREWVRAAREAGLALVALAGSLDEAGVERSAALGADVVGVRGAACEGGRGGCVSAARVRRLSDALRGREPSHLFVYGTLRAASGGAMHRLLARHATFAGEASFAGQLYDAGAYPAVVSSAHPGDLVRGELYAIDAAGADVLLRRLDEYEGCAEGLFRRERATVTAADGRPVRAWVYLYGRPTGRLRRIPSGDYAAR